MKKVICDVMNGYDSRIREIRLVFTSDRFKVYGGQYTTLTLAVMYVRPQKSLHGGKVGIYTFNHASEFISFLKSLKLSEWYLSKMWEEFEKNDRIADELEMFLNVDECLLGKEVERLKEMFNK